MSFSAKILCDSISPAQVRLTTMEVTFPRMILAEFNTHRAFSRNSASSRAIPVEKMIKRVMDDPFIPIYWGENQKGMQAGAQIPLIAQVQSTDAWLAARDQAVFFARRLIEKGVHKQITNRLLEPFMWHTVIVTATEWDNFFALRTHPSAQPEMQTIAKMMQHQYQNSSPEAIDWDWWHLPLLDDQAELIDTGWYDVEALKKISVGRCARVSYLTHSGVRDPRADIELCDRLIESGHMSPLEHLATPLMLGASVLPGVGWSANFRGWEQYRRSIPHEDNFGARPQ